MSVWSEPRWPTTPPSGSSLCTTSAFLFALTCCKQLNGSAMTLGSMTGFSSGSVSASVSTGTQSMSASAISSSSAISPNSAALSARALEPTETSSNSSGATATSIAILADLASATGAPAKTPPTSPSPDQVMCMYPSKVQAWADCINQLATTNRTTIEYITCSAAFLPTASSSASTSGKPSPSDDKQSSASDGLTISKTSGAGIAGVVGLALFVLLSA